MKTYAVVQSSKVQNIIIWDGNTEEWQPPRGSVAIAVPDDVVISIGYTATELEGVWTYLAPAVEEAETVTSNP
ncbi:hypothetical protein F3J16_05220 [Burkholderia sp. Ap-962]|uniref:hypothetical protein n=1 Tax=Burkholderia sp. Ap-962 TaxID=2608333 RepID=UPI0014200620|nr:hypothetical protein [Burkholderia sp. Ap-962]NIF69596.1 hypothetical protein [Burkholderia sp. Ap-962]